MDGARSAPDPLADRYVRRNIALLAAIENTPGSAQDRRIRGALARRGLVCEQGQDRSRPAGGEGRHGGTARGSPLGRTVHAAPMILRATRTLDWTGAGRQDPRAMPRGRVPVNAG